MAPRASRPDDAGLPQPSQELAMSLEFIGIRRAPLAMA
jgi:hypothetical protein